MNRLAQLPPGYVVTWPGPTPRYSYSPYRATCTLYRWTARGLNEHRDPDWQHVWAPDRDTARMLALQELSSVTIDPRPSRVVEPGGEPGGEPQDVQHEGQMLRLEAERLLASRGRIMPVAKEDPRIAHWLADFEAKIEELFTLADGEPESVDESEPELPFARAA